MSEGAKVIVYHAPCVDGFAAASVFWARDRKRAFVPYTHGKTTAEQLVPQVQNKRVVFVDVCPPIAIIKAVADVASSVLVLDHHETAVNIAKQVTFPNVTFHIDQSASGAVLAYQWCYGKDARVPLFLELIDDHDRGCWQMAETRPFIEYLKSKPYDFDTYTEFVDNDIVLRSVKLGQTLLDAQWARVYEIIANAKQGIAYVNETMFSFVIVNSCTDLTAVGHALLQRFPEIDMAITWWYDHASTERPWVFSLRSVKPDVNVAKIAEQLGHGKGGGHVHAAGFRAESDFEAVQNFIFSKK